MEEYTDFFLHSDRLVERQRRQQARADEQWREAEKVREGRLQRRNEREEARRRAAADKVRDGRW